MHNKDKVILDKKLPYEYNICLYVLEELCDKGIIDVFEMTEAIILLRKKYKMPVISIYGKKDNNSNIPLSASVFLTQFTTTQSSLNTSHM